MTIDSDIFNSRVTPRFCRVDEKEMTTRFLFEDFFIFSLSSPFPTKPLEKKKNHRAKVKFNVNRSDNMIIQAICLLDQLDKDINKLSMRVREWYSWHFPELVKIVSDPYMYARLVVEIGDRNTLSEDNLEKITNITMDEDLSKKVLLGARTSMGMDVSEGDLVNINAFAIRVRDLLEYRVQLYAYLQDKMAVVAPNLGELIGEVVAARLISHAGSLTNLAKAPASTVQILGAEKGSDSFNFYFFTHTSSS